MERPTGKQAKQVQPAKLKPTHFVVFKTSISSRPNSLSCQRLNPSMPEKSPFFMGRLMAMAPKRALVPTRAGSISGGSPETGNGVFNIYASGPGVIHDGSDFADDGSIIGTAADETVYGGMTDGQPDGGVMPPKKSLERPRHGSSTFSRSSAPSSVIVTS